MHAVVYTVITKGWEGGQPTVEIAGGKYVLNIPTILHYARKGGGRRRANPEVAG